MTNVLGGRGVGRARSEPRFRVAWLCFVPEFGRCSFSPSRVPSPLSKVRRREGDGALGGQEDGGGRRARYPEPGLHLPVSLRLPPVPTGWEIQGLLLPVLGASGCRCHLGPPTPPQLVSREHEFPSVLFRGERQSANSSLVAQGGGARVCPNFPQVRRALLRHPQHPPPPQAPSQAPPTRSASLALGWKGAPLSGLGCGGQDPGEQRAPQVPITGGSGPCPCC